METLAALTECNKPTNARSLDDLQKFDCLLNSWVLVKHALNDPVLGFC